MADPERKMYSKSAENEEELKNLRIRGREEKHECLCHNSRKLFREHNDVTGIHGMRYLTEKRSRTEKVLWTIILLASLGGFIYMMYEILQKYFSSPVVVSFATEDTPIYQIPFPTVTICPEHKYASDKYNYTDMVFSVLALEPWMIDDEELTKFNHVTLLCDSGFDYTKKLEDAANKTIDQESFFSTVDEVKPNPNMFHTCSFMGQRIDCSKLLQPIIIDEGVCYSFNILDRSEIFQDHVFHYKDYYRVKNVTNSFNIEKGYATGSGINAYPRRALTSGADNSLTIVLAFNNEDVDYTCNSYFQGWRVWIHSPFEVPRLSKHYFRIPLNKVIVAGVVPQLITTSEEVRAFDPDKRKCFMSDENHLKHFKSYTQSNCILECVTNYTLHKCGCVAYYMPRDNATKICGLGSEDCVDDAERQLKIDSLQYEINQFDIEKNSLLNCDCKPSCAQLQFHIETSHSDFSYKDYSRAAALLSRFQDSWDFNVKADVIKETEKYEWSVMQVYFKSEQFMPIERNQLYGISDLISNLGGLLGLFTGFSLITVAEIIYFLTLRMYCNKKLYGHWSGPPD